MQLGCFRLQLAGKGKVVELDVVRADIEQRDRIDSTRKDGPLVRPEGCVVIDTSNMNIEQVVDAMTEAVRSVMECGSDA